MDKFWQALAQLLPTGFAWPREASSTLMRVLRGMAGSFDELHETTHQIVRQWQPATTVNRLAEWEAATGLPDACFGNDQPVDLRRRLLLLRLRGADLPFDDSSPAAPRVIEALCLSFGYPATVAYNTPFRCGHRVGRRLGRLDGRLYITLTLPGGRFRVGQNRIGDRLIDGATGHELVCLLKRVLPARFELVFILV
jgi:uncharacterized protein YmfQ (DUF2313 family)